MAVLNTGEIITNRAGTQYRAEVPPAGWNVHLVNVKTGERGAWALTDVLRKLDNGTFSKTEIRCASCAGVGKLPNGTRTDFVICDVCDGSGRKAA